MKLARLLLTSAAFCGVAAAIPILPDGCSANTVNDSQPLAQSCYDGRQVYALPFSTWLILGNDNSLNGPNDWDGNDGMVQAQVNATGTSIAVTFLGGLSAHADYMTAGGTFLFWNYAPIGTTVNVATTPGAYVPFSLTDTATGTTFSSTPENRSLIIRRIDVGRETNLATPEPSSWALLGVGGVAVLLRRRYGMR